MITEDRKIVCYSIDNKTAKSLELQFKREYVYNMVLAKLLEDFKDT